MLNDIHHVVFRALLSAGLVITACGSAAPQSQPAATVTISPPVKLVGEVSVEELAKRPANVQTRRVPAELPRLLLPDSSPASGQMGTAPNTLPRIPPDVGVAPSFASVKGFVGIHSIDNVTANGFEYEPPNLGLAVNNNIALEISRYVLQIFNASTGAALTGPVALTSFFKT